MEWPLWMRVHVYRNSPRCSKPYSSLSHRILKHMPLWSDFVPQGNFLGNVRRPLIRVPETHTKHTHSTHTLWHKSGCICLCCNSHGWTTLGNTQVHYTLHINTCIYMYVHIIVAVISPPVHSVASYLQVFDEVPVAEGSSLQHQVDAEPLHWPSQLPLVCLHRIPLENELCHCHCVYYHVACYNKKFWCCVCFILLSRTSC